jgi:dGTPase
MQVYASNPQASRGRLVAEEESANRSVFQRDRDRIIHSTAFRRLKHKTQVFVYHEGDHYRTRLTHSIEVAQIARSIARSLDLNEDLAEAVALAHDLGHTPFGHAGEDALDECLVGLGGFSHNQFALTLAEDLESRYAAFPGLNLTFEVLEGQATRTDKDAAYAMTGLAPLLEVQVVETADSMTYDAHDTDDAVKLQLGTLDELAKCRLVGEAVAGVRAQYANLRDDLLRKAVVHQLIDRQVSDVLATTSAILATAGNMPAQEVRRSAIRIVPSRELAEQKHELERFLYDEVYRHPRLIAVRAEAQSRLKEMFERFRERPELLPPHFQARGAAVGVPRAVGDYLAGMTDRYCDQQYRQHIAGA